MHPYNVGDPSPDHPGWTWQEATCDRGHCYHTVARFLPDDRQERDAELDKDPEVLAHRASAHGEGAAPAELKNQAGETITGDAEVPGPAAETEPPKPE